MILIKMYLVVIFVLLIIEDWCLLGWKIEGFLGSDLLNCILDVMFELICEFEKNIYWKFNEG